MEEQGTFQRILDIIDKGLKSKGLKNNPNVIAKLANVDRKTVVKWINGSEPAAKSLVKLAQELDISLDSIFGIRDNGPFITSRAAVEPEYATAEEVEGWSDVKRVLQSNQPVKIFRVIGDSMSPTLYDTDLLFCIKEHNFEEIRQSYVYVVESLEHGWLTKRVVKTDDHTITISSDNKKYKTYPLTLGEEVLSLWRVRAYMSWQLGAPIYDHERMVSIEGLLFDMKEKIESL